MREPRPRFGVLGFGRFGAFAVRHLEPFGEVVVHDPEVSIPFPLRAVSFAEAAAARSVILAVPIRAIPETLRALRPRLHPGTLVADTASVKTLPLAWMEQFLPADVEYVGTHPLFGPDSARDGLGGHRIVLVPGRIAALRLERLQRLFHRMGLRVVTATAEAHDRSLARTQALTHWLGRSLTAFGAGPESIDTHGYRLLLQVAHWTERDRRALFEDMHRYNPYAGEVRSRFRAALSALDDELSAPPQDPE